MKDFDPGWGESVVCGGWHGKPIGAGDDAEFGRYRNIEEHRAAALIKPEL